MLRLRTDCISVWLILSALAGCKFNSPTSLAQPAPRAVHPVIAGLDSAIVAREGELRVVAFQVTALGQGSLPVADIPISLRVSAGSGEIAPAIAVSDSNGIGEAVYYIIVPYGDTTATLTAAIPADSASTQIAIHGSPAPVALLLQVNPDTIYCRPRQPQTAALTVRVLDARGNGVPECAIAIERLAGAISIPKLLVTDQSGNVAYPLKIDGKWFGDLTMTARVVDAPNPIPARLKKQLASLPTLTAPNEAVLADTITVTIRPVPNERR